jgi:ABC-type protease/lipase transport system fused ATPase/permease subunit
VDSLPGKLATRVFEGGGNLAPERRFQVALAAALLARPQVLLVDDTRVALDADAERAVDEALARFAHRGGTVLRATLRPAARASADLHLALESGRPAEPTSRDDRAWLH